MTTLGPTVYAYEKLLVALDSLATGPGDVRTRLLSAYQSFWPLSEEQFPEHLRGDYKWVVAQLTKYGPIYDYKGRLDRGSVEATLRRITNRTGVKVATKLLQLYHELDAYVRRDNAPSNSAAHPEPLKHRTSSRRSSRRPGGRER